MDKIEKAETTTVYGHICADFTFDNFVVGSCNAFSVAACQAVVEQPGEVYNPLYIHGQTGTGKTHLIHAIANALLAAGSKKIVLRTGESFVNEMIAAIRAGTLQSFRDKFRGADVLIIDDIQFIAGKERTQEEFFHTFNALYENKKQIILTADRSPGALTDVMECLNSRFGSGLMAELSLPDLDTRLEFISEKQCWPGSLWMMRPPPCWHPGQAAISDGLKAH